MVENFEVIDYCLVGGGCINIVYKLIDGICSYFVKIN